MTIQEIDIKLNSRKSSERKIAAKAIGELNLNELGDSLLNAYIKEKADKRTWEVKVEMIVSFGLINYKKALPEIEIIINLNLPYDMITYAAAQTYIRLKRESLNDSKTIIELLQSGGLSLVTGALIPLGNDRMMPPTKEIIELIELSWDLQKHPDRIGKENGYLDPRYGLALACAGWDKELTSSFLNHCLISFGKDTSLKAVSENSLKGKYGKLR